MCIGTVKKIHEYNPEGLRALTGYFAISNMPKLIVLDEARMMACGAAYYGRSYLYSCIVDPRIQEYPSGGIFRNSAAVCWGYAYVVEVSRDFEPVWHK